MQIQDYSIQNQSSVDRFEMYSGYIKSMEAIECKYDQITANSINCTETAVIGNLNTFHVSAQNLDLSSVSINNASVNNLVVDSLLANQITGSSLIAAGTITPNNLIYSDLTVQTINAASTTAESITTIDFDGTDINCNVLNTSSLSADTINCQYFESKETTTVDFNIVGAAGSTNTGPRIVASTIKNGQVDTIVDYNVVNNTTSTFSDLQLSDTITGPNSFYIYGTNITNVDALPIITSWNPQLNDFDNQTGFGDIGNYMSFYSTSGRTIRFDADGNLRIWSNPNTVFWQTMPMISDERDKLAIEPISNALDKVCSLNGVYFNYMDSVDSPRQAGLLAQEVKEVMPGCIISSNIKDAKLSVDYESVIPFLIEAFKELLDEFNTINGL